MAETGYLNTANPLAELVAELNPEFERRHRLDRRNVGVLLGDLTEVQDSMRMMLALEEVEVLSGGEPARGAQTQLKACFLDGRRTISRYLSRCMKPPVPGTWMPAPIPRPERYAKYLWEQVITETNISDKKRVRLAYEPWSRFYQVRNQEMRKRIEALRTELTSQLQGLGESGVRLDYLDRALHASIETRSEVHLAKLAPHLEAEFVTAFNRARETTPGSVDEVAVWCDVGGWIEQFKDTMLRYLRTILHFRLQPLQGLVEAGCSLTLPRH